MSKTKNPVNIYVTKCCQVAGQKEACERTKEEKAEKKFGEASLGTWRCPRCGKKASVIPQKNLDKSAQQV
jgi:hypothetical protein